MEAEEAQSTSDGHRITLEELPDQALIRKIGRNDDLPSTKTTQLQSQSLEKLMLLDVSKLTKTMAQEWLVFSRNNIVETGIAEEGRQAEMEQLKGTVQSLLSETRETNGIKQISEFAQKVVGKMISPSFTRPILFKVGFAAIDVSSIVATTHHE